MCICKNMCIMYIYVFVCVCMCVFLSRSASDQSRTLHTIHKKLPFGLGDTTSIKGVRKLYERSFFRIRRCDVNESIVLQCAALCCSVLQCAAGCCSVLQCVAVCCSEMQQRRAELYSCAVFAAFDCAM